MDLKNNAKLDEHDCRRLLMVINNHRKLSPYARDRVMRNGFQIRWSSKMAVFEN